MTKYLKYLVKNPSKLLFALGVTVFTLTLLVLTIINSEEFIMENSVGLFVFTEVFLSVILVAGNYQVYKEWKDGLNR